MLVVGVGPCRVLMCNLIGNSTLLASHTRSKATIQGEEWTGAACGKDARKQASPMCKSKALPRFFPWRWLHMIVRESHLIGHLTAWPKNYSDWQLRNHQSHALPVFVLGINHWIAHTLRRIHRSPERSMKTLEYKNRFFSDVQSCHHHHNPYIVPFTGKFEHTQ